MNNIYTALTVIPGIRHISGVCHYYNNHATLQVKSKTEDVFLEKKFFFLNISGGRCQWQMLIGMFIINTDVVL